MLQFEPGLAIWTVITFLVLLLLLSKTAWPKILSVLDERENKIKSSIKDAEKARDDAEKMILEHKNILDKAKKEAAEIIRKGNDRAEKIHGEARELAKEEARNLIQSTKVELEREREKAITDLKDRVADLSITVAAKIIGSSLTPEQHLERAQNAIKEMESQL